MAIDTAQKRRSSASFLLPFFTTSVSIDGSMSQADRQESAWGYSGILAAAPIGLQIVTLLSAVVSQPTISIALITSDDPFGTPQNPSVTASITQPTISSVTAKNDVT